MLQDLLDRIANGGLDITIVSVKDLDAVLGKDSPTMQATRVTEWFLTNEQTVTAMCRLLANHGQPERAERLRKWWDELCQPVHELATHLPAEHSERSKEEDLVFIQRIVDVGRPAMECGRAVLKGIIERQVEAMVLMDFDDLIS